MLPILQELFGGVWRTLVFVKSRGKCCHFSGGTLRWPLVHISFLLKAGEMLPIFLEELFGGLWCTLAFVKSRGKCCPFFRRNSSVAFGVH